MLHRCVAIQEEEAIKMRNVYLHPGQMIASSEPCAVTTILGSCVSVCLWDEGTGAGGMNHFLLPHWAGKTSSSPRFGSVAMAQLLEMVLREGARREALSAKVFGGASVLEALRHGTHPLGPKNVGVARDFLREARIAVTEEDVFGDHGRRLSFQTHDGKSQVRLLAGGTHGTE